MYVMPRQNLEAAYRK